MNDGHPVPQRRSVREGRYLAEIALLALLYYVAARASLRIALVADSITPLWPPTGIAVVALLRYGRRLWPGIALAALLVNLPLTADGAAVAIAVGNTLAPIVVAWLLGRLGFRTEMDRARDVAALVAAALGGMAISATIGSGALVISSTVPTEGFWTAWSVWWTGDAMGVLVVAPFLLSLSSWRRSTDANPDRRWVLGFVGLLCLLVAASVIAERTDGRLLFLIPPVVGWVAWQFQLRGAAPAVLLASALAVRAAVRATGWFADLSLREAMFTLQTFNATLAFSAFFLSALVADRMRARAALQAAAVRLESRVDERTAALTTANERLQREIAERRAAETRLRESERDLAEAQDLARLGRWEWDLLTQQVVWSDDMYRIHGHDPGAFPMTFDRAVEQVESVDRRRIEDNVADGIRRRVPELPEIEYRITRPDGERRVLLGRARLFFGSDGAAVRMLGVVQDVTEHRAYERQHEIADTLQRALLPQELPSIHGLDIGAHYVPAEAGARAGGDWYDVIALSRGRVGLVIGDVAGHGLEAASTMGQLRMGVRSFALEGHSPTDVVMHADGLLRAVAPQELATMLYAEIDPEDGRVSAVSAGHPPPVLLTASGATYLALTTGPPIGMADPGRYEATAAALEVGATALLYTDGLTDLRDVPIDQAADRLLDAARSYAARPVDELCRLLTANIVAAPVADDVAVLAVRMLRRDARRLFLRFPAEPAELAGARRSVARWLGAHGADPVDRDDLVLALSEACTNAVKHAYGPGAGWVEVEAVCSERLVDITVRDFGHWRAKRGDLGGMGIGVMQASTTSMDIERRSDGTSVRLSKRLMGAVAP